MPKSLFGFYELTIREYWVQILTIFLLNIIYYAGGSIITPVSIKMVIGAIENAVAGGYDIMAYAMPAVILVCALNLLILGADIISDIIKGKYMPILDNAVSKRIYEYIFSQTYSFFKKNSAGHIAEQAKYISSKFYGLVVTYPRVLVVLFISFIVNFGLLFDVHWSMLVIIASCAIFRLVYCTLNVKKMADAYVKSARISSKLTGKFVDSLSNVLNIKLFSTQKKEENYLGRFREEKVAARQISKYRERVFWIPPFSFEKVCTGAILALSVYLYSKGMIKISDIAFSVTSFDGIMRIIRNMTWEMPDFLDNYGSAKQAYQEIVEPVSILDCDDAQPMKLRACHINFNKISFKYADEWIIKDLTLCIRHGEHIGIVGGSGSGKTTLVNLLMRLYDIDAGSITIDGNDIRFVTQDSLRKNIAFIPQESILFNRTLSENISYGTDDVTQSQIEAAARAAYAHDFIMASDDGYDTIVGDRGMKLSGGQRQRITIAHAILKNSPILILDEATSALDSETELAIQDSFEKLMKNRTTIAIAHRLSTLKKMDRIVVLDHGRIAEMGTHSELIKKKNGLYKKLWGMQSDGFIK